MRVVFDDPTPRWVPFATIALICVMTWGYGIYEDFEFAATTIFSIGLFVVLFVAIFLQGWMYWRDSVARLSLDGDHIEAVTMRWVGPGRRLRFEAHEVTDWHAVTKAGQAGKLASIDFKVRGEKLSLSMNDPRVLDLEALSTLAPEFFASLRREYPHLSGDKAEA